MMKIIILAFAVSAASTLAPAHVAGQWKIDFQRDSREPFPTTLSPSVCRLKQDGRTLTGDCGSDSASVMGDVTGRRVTVRVENDNRATLTGEVSADGTTMKGTWHNKNGFGRFTAAKQ